MEHREFTQVSEALLFSAEFQELRTALEFREPNIWHILGISRREIRVSRFLAWLLHPQEKHSFGDRFLKSLVMCSLQTEIGRQSDLTPVDVHVMDLSNVQVQIEYPLGTRRCDIVAHSLGKNTDRDAGLLCVIENKIEAREAQDQTRDYYEASLEEFPLEEYPHRVYIYLSPDGAPPQSGSFTPLSYQEVLKVIESLKDNPQVTETERFLLQQFQENILRGIAMDARTIDLAQAIYDQHRDVLEFIFQNVVREPEDDTSSAEQSWDGKSRFFNIGEMAGSGYQWDDCHEYSFICAGGGERYRKWMEQLKVGDIIYAYVNGRGYVGIGTVTQKALPFREAKLDDGQPLLNVGLVGEYSDSEDNDTCDWIAFVKWEYAVEKNQAVRQGPISRLTTCRIYDRRKDVVERVRSELAKKHLR